MRRWLKRLGLVFLGFVLGLCVSVKTMESQGTYWLFLAPSAATTQPHRLNFTVEMDTNNGQVAFLLYWNTRLSYVPWAMVVEQDGQVWFQRGGPR